MESEKCGLNWSAALHASVFKQWQLGGARLKKGTAAKAMARRGPSTTSGTHFACAQGKHEDGARQRLPH